MTRPQKMPCSAEHEPDSAHGYTDQAIDSAVSLLMLIGDQPNLGLSELARRLGAGKARTYRQLKTLEERGFVVCSEPARTWRLGLATLMLGAKASGQIDLVGVAESRLARLGESVQETVQPRVANENMSVCVAAREPMRELRVHSVIGRERPLHVGSSKVILAYMSEADQLRILARSRERYTEHTLVDLAQLKSVLAQIREDGIDISRGVVSADLMSISAPIFRVGRVIAGVISISSPASRMTETLIKRHVQLVKETAAELSFALGGRVLACTARSPRK